MSNRNTDSRCCFIVHSEFPFSCIFVPLIVGIIIIESIICMSDFQEIIRILVKFRNGKCCFVKFLCSIGINNLCSFHEIYIAVFSCFQFFIFRISSDSIIIYCTDRNGTEIVIRIFFIISRGRKFRQKFCTLFICNRFWQFRNKFFICFCCRYCFCDIRNIGKKFTADSRIFCCLALRRCKLRNDICFPAAVLIFISIAQTNSGTFF